MHSFARPPDQWCGRPDLPRRITATGIPRAVNDHTSSSGRSLSTQLASEEVANSASDLRSMRLKSEMAGVVKMYFCSGIVALKGGAGNIANSYLVD